MENLFGEVDTYGYEDEKWLVFLRDHGNTHKGMIKNAQPHAVDRQEAIRYRGNLFGYLKSIGCSEISHWINMKINGIDHPSEFDERVQLLHIVRDEFIYEWYGRFYEVTFKHEKIERQHKKI